MSFNFSFISSLVNGFDMYAAKPFSKYFFGACSNTSAVTAITGVEKLGICFSFSNAASLYP